MAPRIRTIKPELWQSADFLALSLLGRLTFLALISNADDAGRLRTDAKHLARTFLSGSKAEAVDAQLSRMAEHGMVVRYVADGHDCLALLNWHHHQKVDHPGKSRIPPPPDPEDQIPLFPEDSRGFASSRESRVPGGASVDRTRPDRTRPDPTGPTRAPEREKAGDNSADGTGSKDPRTDGSLTKLGDVLAAGRRPR